MEYLTKKFLLSSRFRKQIIAMLADILMLCFALWFAFSLRLSEWYVPDHHVFRLFFAAPLIAIPIFIHFGLYRAIIRYIGFKALWAVIKAVSLYALLWATVVLLSGVGMHNVPRSVSVINWLVAILLIGGSRMIVRWWLSDTSIANRSKGVNDNTCVVIYGAGSAGMQLANALSYNRNYHPVAFIDDNVELHRCHINSLRVYPFTQLGYLIEKKKVSEVLLALPSISRSRRHKILQMLEPYPVHVRTLPAMSDIVGGQVKVADLKEIDIDDLLGRDSVEPDEKLLGINIRDKVVMVTGAGGTIGSELCRQILRQSPNKLILFEQNEYALYSISKELKRAIKTRGAGEVVSILGNVLDEKRLELVLCTYEVKTIYHAAAYKHVPIVENNPVEAIRNNIFGTLRTARAAIKANVKSFVLISTDKAVRPTNTMGASKRFAELVLQSFGNSINAKTCFSMVRFGNVLDSSGSVIPLFSEQIHQGGPVTVTDKKIIRYFMTIQEAAELVIQAGAMGEGGDVFVLDMGEPVKIYELAKKMIHLCGLEVKSDDNPDGDIEIQFTGLRHGEKLYEELLIGGNVRPTKHPLIMRAEEESLSLVDVEKYLEEFENACKMHDQEKVRKLLLEAVKGFVPQCGIEDHVYKEDSRKKGYNVHVLFDRGSA